MGHDISYQLREDNLMTKILLKEQDKVIQHIEQEKIDLEEPINQMGDSILHYAAYNSLKTLMEYLLDKGCDPNACNNRGISPKDVALPEIRQWIIQKYSEKEGKEKQPSDHKTKKKEILQSVIIANHITKQ